MNNDAFFVYDGNEKLTHLTDTNGIVTNYTYDSNGNMLTRVMDPGSGHLGLTTSWTYDGANNVLTVTNPATIVTKYTYDTPTTGNVVTAIHNYKSGDPTNSDTNVTTSDTYDSYGEVLTTTDALGVVTKYTYDGYGDTLTATENYQSGGASDDHTNVTTSATYDDLGEQMTSTNALGIVTATVYDIRGNVQQTTENYQSGGSTDAQTNVKTQYGYDALDRQATMNDGSRSYTYDLAGNVTHMQVVVSGSGYTVQADSTYDGGNRITSLYDRVGPSATILHSYGYTYTYDGRGNRSSITEDGATTTNYSYDDLNQLTQVKVGSTTTATYGYDANHNRTSLVTAAGTTSYTYDSSDHLTQKTDPDGKVTTYGYDTLGNLTSASYDPTGVNQVTAYHYDANGRLTEIDQPNGTTIQFGYDADNNRTTKTITTGGVSHSVNDVYVLGHLAYETDENGTVLATFTYDTMGVPVSVQVGSDPNNSPRYYYVYNGHGDVVALVDAAGRCRWQHRCQLQLRRLWPVDLRQRELWRDNDLDQPVSLRRARRGAL
jgi:YD repeat-containing protein